MLEKYLNFSCYKEHDGSYYSPVIISIKTLSFLIKHVFMLMLSTENIGLQDCVRFLQIVHVCVHACVCIYACNVLTTLR